MNQFKIPVCRQRRNQISELVCTVGRSACEVSHDSTIGSPRRQQGDRGAMRWTEVQCCRGTTRRHQLAFRIASHQHSILSSPVLSTDRGAATRTEVQRGDERLGHLVGHVQCNCVFRATLRRGMTEISFLGLLHDQQLHLRAFTPGRASPEKRVCPRDG
jgi:hypothetical protein